MKRRAKESPDKTTTRFLPPSVQEVAAYCTERKNGINAEQFRDYYESKGWMIGKNKMKDWRAAVRTWEKNESQFKPQAPAPVVIKDTLCPYCKAKIIGTAGFCSKCGWRQGDDLKDKDNIDFYDARLNREAVHA